MLLEIKEKMHRLSLKIRGEAQKPKGETIFLGKIKNSFKKEYLTEAELNHHVHIVGASGFGKTVFLSHLVHSKIKRHQGVLFMDLKGDIETIRKFSEMTLESNRLEDLSIFSISDPTISMQYNLVGQGTATQLRDKIMMSLTWSEEYYKNQSASFLLKLLIGLCELRDSFKTPFSLRTIYESVKDPEFVSDLSQMLPENSRNAKVALEDCYQFLSQNENYKSLQGLRTQLESLVLSDFGELISSTAPGIDLFDIIMKGKILFIFLDSRRYSETAKTIGKFILQDLKMATSRIDAEVRKAARRSFVTIIDEFADLAQEDFLSFLDRARSSKMSVIVAHQELCDLQRISPEFAGRLMGNTSTMYAFLQKRPESAEVIAKMAGTHREWKETLRSRRMLFWDIPTGDKSLREVEEFNIHPNIVKSLQVGECVVIKKYPSSRSYILRVRHDS